MAEQQRILFTEEDAQIFGEILADNNITDETIKNNVIIDIALATFLFLAFCLLQRSSILYRFRLVSPSVTYKPRELPTKGWAGVFGWMWASVAITDKELLTSCGLDALMMVKASELGVQLFLPLTLVGLSVLLPIHLHGGAIMNLKSQTSNYLRFTVSNLGNSTLLWIHVVLLHVYIAYACWLLRWHYQQFMVIRQFFLKKGEDVNMWRMLYQGDKPPASQLAELFGLVPMLKNFGLQRLSNTLVNHQPHEGLPGAAGHTTLTLEGAPAQGTQTADNLAVPVAGLQLTTNSMSPLLPDSADVSHPTGGIASLQQFDQRVPPQHSASPLLPKLTHKDSSAGAAAVGGGGGGNGGVGGAAGGGGAGSQLELIAALLSHEREHAQQQVLRSHGSNRQTLSSTGIEQAVQDNSDTLLELQPRVQSLVGRRDLRNMYTIDERRRRMAALNRLINAEQQSHQQPDAQPSSPLRTTPFLRGGHSSVPLPKTSSQPGASAAAHAPQYLEAAQQAGGAGRPLGGGQPVSAFITAAASMVSPFSSSSRHSLNLLHPVPPPEGGVDVPLHDAGTETAPTMLDIERVRSSAPEQATVLPLETAGSGAVRSRAEALRQGLFAPSFNVMLHGAGSGAVADQLPATEPVRQPVLAQLVESPDLAPTPFAQLPLLPLPALPEPPARPPLPSTSGNRSSPRTPVMATPDSQQTPTISEIEPAAAASARGRGSPAGTSSSQHMPPQIGRAQDDNAIRQRPSRPHHRRVPSEGTETLEQTLMRSRLASQLQTSPSQHLLSSRGGAPPLMKPSSFQTMYTDGGAVPSMSMTRQPGGSRDLSPDARRETPETYGGSRQEAAGIEELLDEVPRWWGKVVLKADLLKNGSSSSHQPSFSAKGSLEPAALSRTSLLGSAPPPQRATSAHHARSASAGASPLPPSAFALPADQGSAQVSVTGTSPANSDAPMLAAPQRSSMTRKQAAALPIAWTVPAALEVPTKTGDEDEGALQQLDLLAMPSVRARKTINTRGFRDDIIAVNAEHYVVLVTDVPQPLYAPQPSPSCIQRHSTNMSAASTSSHVARPPALSLSLGPDLKLPTHPDQVYIEMQGISVGGDGGDSSSGGGGGGGGPLSPTRGPGGTGGGSGQLNGGLHGLGMGGLHADQAFILRNGNTAGSGLQQPGAATGAVGGAVMGIAAGQGMSEVDKEEVLRQRVAWLWDRVRAHVRRRTVQALLYEPRYSMVAATFKQMFPRDFDRAIPVIKHKTVDLLLRKQDLHLAAYEQARLVYDRTGKRLKTRLGLFGLFGTKVDALEHHRQQLVDLRRQIKSARAVALATQATPSWFVLFKTQMAASIATATPLHAHDDREFKVRPAPGPEEVNWSALWLTWRQRDLRCALVTPLMLALILIPIGIFTGGLQQVDALVCPVKRCTYQVIEAEKIIVMTRAMGQEACDAMGGVLSGQNWTWTWYCERKSPIAKLLGWFVVGWGPALLLILWQAACLPLGLYLLTQMSGQCFSLSAVDRTIARWLFYFAVFNVFLGGMLGSAIVHSVTQFVRKGPLEVFVIIGTSLPTSSNFFLNYLLFRAFVGLPVRLVIPHVGVRLFLVRRYLRCVMMLTERDKAVLYAPVSPRYGFEYGMLSIIFLVGCAFSVVSPLLLPLVLFFFMLSFLFWRYSLLYVYVRKYESGGMMWPFLFRRVIQCLYIASLFTACVMMVHQAYIQAIILFVTIPVILVRFSRYCRLRFHLGVKGVPMEYATQAPRAEVDPWVYIPPPCTTRRWDGTRISISRGRAGTCLWAMQHCKGEMPLLRQVSGCEW